jgi:hypothetical protein
MNRDGNFDFAAAHQNGTPYFGDGQGHFVQRHLNLPSGGTIGFRGVSLGDIDNDGAKELAFVLNGGVHVWKWSTQQWVNVSANLPTSGSYSVTRLHDMNSDGFLDVLAFGNGTLTVWAGDGGTTWRGIAGFTTPSPGTYSGIAVGDVDHNGFPDIIIEAAEGGTFDQYNKIRLFKHTTTPSSLDISPLHPRGHERIRAGSVHFVDWTSAVPEGSTARVRLEYSTAGNSGPWMLLADSLPNNGRYQWRVQQGVQSVDCFIRYIVYAGQDRDTAMTPAPFEIGGAVGVGCDEPLPESPVLFQNYPNPFNLSTTIVYRVPGSSGSADPQGRRGEFVELTVFDVLGREVATLVIENQDAPLNQPDRVVLAGDAVGQAGLKSVQWDASGLAGGVYFYRLQTGQSTTQRKMLLVK